MRKTLSILVVLFVAVALSAGTFPAVGKSAPKFKLTSDQGKPTTLRDFRGKWVVLYFYPKDFTSGCTLEARNFQRDLEQYTKRKAVIVGVSIDSAESHKEFCAKEGLSFRLLSDPNAAVSNAYNSVIDYKGTKLSARNTFIINPRGKLVRVFEKVKPAGHSAEVLAALDDLQKRKT
jgi:peroxiredoxin Q/BCP